MPYRIHAVNQQGQRVTRMDLNPQSQQPTDPVQAQQIADAWAQAQQHAGPWQGKIEFYEVSTANPLWNRTAQGVEDPVYSKSNIRVKSKPGHTQPN